MWLITAAEFATGLVVNLLLGWQVWDYSAEPANLLGQICLRYSFYWFCLCFGWFLIVRLVRKAGAALTRRKANSPSAFL